MRRVRQHRLGPASLIAAALSVLAAPAPARAGDEAAPPAAAAAAPAAAAAAPWCAPELEALPGDVCHFAAPEAAAGAPPSPRTLVIFLHGVIQPGTTWQWAQQRGIVLGARRHGFSVLMPRGRQGIGPRNMTDWFAWPTSSTAQAQVEASVVDEWLRARQLLEARGGKPFDEVFVLGFSNGAYYATSLALRGRLEVDGYGVFAGGSGRHLHKGAARVKRRAPIFVGVAAKDRTTVKDSRGLGQALARLKWPRKVESLPVGHAIADRHLEHALEFLRAAAAKARAARRPGAASP